MIEKLPIRVNHAGKVVETQIYFEILLLYVGVRLTLYNNENSKVNKSMATGSQKLVQ